jgi:RHS repeat-associated protein
MSQYNGGLPPVARIVVALFFPLLVHGQTAVSLSPASSPTSGQAGITPVNLTGSGFPTGTIQPTAVTVSLKPAAGGTAVTTLSSAVTTIAGTTRRVTFTIPASISVTTATLYAVSISGSTTTNTLFASSNTAALTINPAAQLLSASPAKGNTGQTLSVTITGANTTFVQGSTAASFGAGISVGGAAAGAAGPVTVTSSTTATAQLTIDPAALLGSRNITVNTGTQAATLTGGFTVTAPPPVITSFAPQSGTVGAIVTINGSNFGASPQVSMTGLSGASISLPLQSMTASSLGVVIPSGAATGVITVANSGATASTASPFTVNAANSFSLSVSPASATLIQGQTVSYMVQLASSNGFNQLAPLSVSGLPSGVTASFKPSSITAGQTSVLTLTAPAGQTVATSSLSISASASVAGIAQSQTASVSLSVSGPTTSLMGRTVVSNSLETPLAGVTVSALGLDGNGNNTGCTGFSTVSDSAGNFALTNLPLQCTGPQLFDIDGTTATSPAGKYAGVNLVFTLAQGQVTASPVLVHLPRIDNVETFMVQQNFASNQSYSFTTIPGLSVTVYSGTTFTMADGTQPNPFPLAAVQVPVDRLPDLKPNVPTMVRVFIVAFQPANTVASQPVAVYFPNVSSTAPGTDMPLMTLDPTHGTMVPYGTGAVSADGSQVIPDIDPAHPGHRYGLVHFDWHGQMPPPPSLLNLSRACGSPNFGNQVDVASGLQSNISTDLDVDGDDGDISVQQVYRDQGTTNGAFGTGADLQYAYQLDTGSPSAATVIKLIAPNGNRYAFARGTNGKLTNSTVPCLQGAVMTTNGAQTSLQYPNGSTQQFQTFAGVSYLSSITDPNGNTTALTVAPMSGSTLRVTQITDPVGRSLNLSYDSNAHLTSVTDPLGRAIAYAYNSSGTLISKTDPNGGVTQYKYDSQNNLTSVIDPRGVTQFQSTFDANGRVIQQVRPDGGVIQYAYTLANPLAPTSPVIQTVVTDPLGNQTTYRFNVEGFLTDVTDSLGQTKSFTLDPGTNQVTQITGPAQCSACGTPGAGNVSFTYDSMGNVLTMTDALGNTTTFTYSSGFNKITSATDALGRSATYSYDAHGNLLSVTDRNGHTTSFAYNSAGLLIKTTDALGNSTTITRDSYGNPVAVTDALGNTTSTVFDGVSRPILTIDALGRRSTVNYDVLNRVTSTVDPRGNTVQFSYDASSNLLSLTDARGNATSFTYDALSRRTSRTSPLGKSESWQYDLDGNVLKYTDRRGQVSQFQYDALNRLVNEQYQDGSTVSRTYDPYSRLLTVNDSLGGQFAYSYDAAGRLLSQSEPNGVVQYSRNALGQVSSEQVVGQSPIAYSYDLSGNLVGSSMAAAGVSFIYDARNLPTAVTRTNGVTSAFSFDQRGALLSLIHAKGATAINRQSYGYDATGKRISATNDLAQPLITQSAVATVDAANELVSNGQTTYSHDLNGNRQTETSSAGRLTYAWDGRNRLSSITDASGNVTAFKYNSGRDLIEIDKTVAGATTAQKFVLDSLTNVVSLTDPATGLPISVLTGRSIDSHFASVDSFGNVAFGVGDSLGSNGGVTNSSGTVTSKTAYDPYGQSGTSPPTSFPFAFTGRVPVTNNILYFRARFYDTSTGRFLSEDPEDFGAGDTNLYRYAGGDPINGSDPTGRGDAQDLGRAAYNLCVQSWNLVEDVLSLAGAGLGFEGEAVIISEELSAERTLAAEAGTVAREEVAAEEAAATNLPTAYWPPNNGFAGEPEFELLQPGTNLGRYGYEGGTYLAPAGTARQSLSLAYGSESLPYTAYTVRKSLPVLSGQAAPAFGQLGGGTQYKTFNTIGYLLQQGYLTK